MKKIVSLVMSLLLALTLITPFTAADTPSIEMTSHSACHFYFKYTGAGAESWVGIYAEGETPGTDTPALIWKSVAAGGAENSLGLDGNSEGERYGSFTNLAAGKYVLRLFADGGYTTIAEAPFEVKQYDFVKEDKYTYLSDLKPLSWVMYEATSEDEEPMFTPSYDTQDGGLNGNKTLNVGGYYYEKGLRSHPGNDTIFNPLINSFDKYAEFVYDISSLDVNRFYTAAGKDSVGQVGWSMNYEILADDQLIYDSGKVTNSQAAYINVSIPAGTKTLTLRALSYEGYNDDSFAFCDAKVWKEDTTKTVIINSASLSSVSVAYTGAASDGSDWIGVYSARTEEEEVLVEKVSLAAGDGDAKIVFSTKLDPEKVYTVRYLSADGTLVDGRSVFTPQTDSGEDSEPASSSAENSDVPASGSSPVSSGSAAATSATETKDNGNKIVIIIAVVAAAAVVAVIAVIVGKKKASEKKA